MVGFVHSLHMQSDLNPKKKLYPFSGDGVFFVPDCNIAAYGINNPFKLKFNTVVIVCGEGK